MSVKNIGFVLFILLSSSLLYYFWDKNNYDATPQTFKTDNDRVTFRLDSTFVKVTEENHENFKNFSTWQMREYLDPQFSPLFLIADKRQIIAYSVTIPFEGFQLDSIQTLADDLQKLESQKETKFNVDDKEMRTSVNLKNEQGVKITRKCRYQLLTEGKGMIQACIGGLRKEKDMLEYYLKEIEF